MQHHVVLTLGRSGSNTLRDMLNQHPAVLNFGEVLGDWNMVRKIQKTVHFPSRSDEAFLDWVLYSRPFLHATNIARNLNKLRQGRRTEFKRVRDLKTFGIKDFSLNFKRSGLSHYLDTRPDIKVVGLVRDNIVERMISNAMLGVSGVVSSRQAGKNTPRKLTIEPSRIAGLLTNIETENAHLAAMLERLPAHRKHVIHYDDLFFDHKNRQNIMDDVFRFLDVEPVKTTERMVKIIRASADEAIENFDECLEALRGTAHERIFREAARRQEPLEAR